MVGGSSRARAAVARACEVRPSTRISVSPSRNSSGPACVRRTILGQRAMYSCSYTAIDDRDDPPKPSSKTPWTPAVDACGSPPPRGVRTLLHTEPKLMRVLGALESVTAIISVACAPISASLPSCAARSSSE